MTDSREDRMTDQTPAALLDEARPMTEAGRRLWEGVAAEWLPDILAIEAEARAAVLQAARERLTTARDNAQRSKEAFVASKDWSLADKAMGREMGLDDAIALLTEGSEP